MSSRGGGERGGRGRGRGERGRGRGGERGGRGGDRDVGRGGRGGDRESGRGRGADRGERGRGRGDRGRGGEFSRSVFSFRDFVFLFELATDFFLFRFSLSLHRTRWSRSRRSRRFRSSSTTIERTDGRSTSLHLRPSSRSPSNAPRSSLPTEWISCLPFATTSSPFDSTKRSSRISILPSSLPIRSTSSTHVSHLRCDRSSYGTVLPRSTDADGSPKRSPFPFPDGSERSLHSTVAVVVSISAAAAAVQLSSSSSLQRSRSLVDSRSTNPVQPSGSSSSRRKSRRSSHRPFVRNSSTSTLQPRSSSSSSHPEPAVPTSTSSTLRPAAISLPQPSSTSSFSSPSERSREPHVPAAAQPLRSAKRLPSPVRPAAAERLPVVVAGRLPTQRKRLPSSSAERFRQPSFRRSGRSFLFCTSFDLPLPSCSSISSNERTLNFPSPPSSSRSTVRFRRHRTRSSTTKGQTRQGDARYAETDCSSFERKTT